MEQREILVRSTMDGTMQPSLFFKSPSPGKRPVLVGLHTWSYGRDNQIKNMLPYAQKYDFNLLLPEFRGNNLESNPNCRLACASRLARQDIADAIDHVIREEHVDGDNVFLLGLSGGGHMTLMMCGLCPERFRAAAAYVPITDLEKFTKQNANYRRHVLACCGSSVEEMKERSPMSYVDTIAKANLKIFHGKFDPLVPVSHSLELYGALMEKYPRSRVFLDIFDGGHEIDMEQAMYWLISQYDEKKLETITG